MFERYGHDQIYYENGYSWFELVKRINVAVAYVVKTEFL